MDKAFSCLFPWYLSQTRLAGSDAELEEEMSVLADDKVMKLDEPDVYRVSAEGHKMTTGIGKWRIGTNVQVYMLTCTQHHRTYCCFEQ